MAAGWSIGGSIGGWATDSMLANATVLHTGDYSAGPAMGGSVPSSNAGSGTRASTVAAVGLPPVVEINAVTGERTTVSEGTGSFAPGGAAATTSADPYGYSDGGTGGTTSTTSGAVSASDFAPSGSSGVGTSFVSNTSNAGSSNMSAVEPLDGDLTPAQRAAAEAAANAAANAAAGGAPTTIPITPPPAQVAPTIKTDKIDKTAVDDLELKKLVAGVAVEDPTKITSTAIKTTEGVTSIAKDVALSVPAGFSTQPKAGNRYPQDMPPEGKMFIYDNETGARKTVSKTGAVTYDAAKAGETGVTQAAQGQVSPDAIAKVDEQTALTREAVAAGRDSAAEEAAKGVAATRPDAKDYLVQQLETDPNYVLEMSGGSRPKDMRYDFNGDGRITSADALALAKDPTLAEYRGDITGVASKVEDVEGPKVTTREGITVSEEEQAQLLALAKERGVNPEDLPEYKLALSRKLQVGTAANKEYSNRLGIPPQEVAAQADYLASQFIADSKAANIKDVPGFVKETAREIQVGTAANKEYADRLGIAPEEVAAQAEFFGSDFTADGGPTDIANVPAFKLAATREAQTGVAAQRIAQELGDAPSVDLEGREAITGTAPQGNAAQIGGVPTMAAAGMQAVTGAARSVGAADMLAVVANVPKAVSAALAEDPAKVIAALDKGGAPNLNAAVAALPVEALVSTQMEQLLAGMEDGKTPAWARPAVDAIEQQMAQRGLSASTVGRDALFNAIIQSALPMAQSNAQALQQRASQNLSNEQQVNLATAQNTMTLRLQNLANTQTSASQTAQMANEIKLQQGSFKQQAVITSAEQAQQTDLTNAQMAQQKSQQESAQRQQAAISTLSVAAQNDLANLQYLNASASQNMTADQQAKLTSYNAQVAKVMRQADLKQDMEKANISQSLQIEMQRISEINAAAKDTMTAEQTGRLTNLQTLIDFRKNDANFAQQMDLSNMSNEQQIELAMLSDRAATDSANFTTSNQFRLNELNLMAERNVKKAELAQRMDEANLDANLKVELSLLSEKNNTSRTNMSSEQQMRLTNLNVLVDFRKTNNAFAQQMDMANMSNDQQMELANLSERAATDAANFTADNQFKLTELTAIVDRNIRKSELDQRMTEVNLDANLKVELAELSEKNATSRANMTTEQQMKLANLNVLVDFRKTNAELAQQMDLVNLGNDQQMELANLAERAATDTANFSEANRFRLQELNNHVNVMSQNEQLRQNADLARLSTAEKISLSNLTQKNQAASESMSAENVAELQVYEKKMAAGQVNAQLAQQMGLANLSNKQEAAMFNAQMNGNLDMKQMDANQQMAIANSQFMQTMTQTKFNADQQAAMQNAAAMASMDMTNIDQRTKLAVTNAQSFLSMDMANLNNNQQGIILDQQMEQQRILSDQSAINAAAQFNAASENDVNQFMASLASNMAQFNTTQSNAMSQFNATEKNRAAAIDAGNEIDIQKFNGQLMTQVDQFNAANDLQRDQWNASNEQAVANSNVEWRRQTNTINTAALNASNQLSAQMTYNIGTAEQANLWQTLRDEANYLRQSYENEEQRKTTLYATALSNEGASGGTSARGLMDLATTFFNKLGGSS
jgi:hypothetical protein